jgi:microcystin-dependent protein
MTSLLPTPWPADPVEGEPGHFDHTNWVKASLIALDGGKLTQPPGNVPAGKVLSTVGVNDWQAVDPSSIGGVPSGVIVAFHGSATPSGWAVCDGTNGTPDLRNRFILGSGTRAAGAVGGAESVTLSAAQSGVPAHTHTTDSKDAAHSHGNNTINLSHSHGARTNNDGGHSHPLWAKQDVNTTSSGRRITGGSQGTDPGSWDGTGGGDHNHTITVDAALSSATQLPDTKSANATHSHNVNANTAAAASQPHDNMPPYYVLVYIMKL